MRFLLCGILLAIAAAWIVGSATHPRTPHRSEEPARLAAVTRDLVLEDYSSDGTRLEIRVGEIRRVGGRLGFLRSPLLDAIELREVQVIEDGELVEYLDVVRVPALGLGEPTLGVRDGGPAAQRIAQLAHVLGTLTGQR